MADELNKIIAAIVAGSPPMKFYKSAATTEGGSTWHSLWKVGTVPAAGSNPPLFSAGSGYVPNDATVGAFPFVNATSPAQKRLLQMSYSGSVAGMLYMYDRLWACSGLSTIVTTAQNITTPGTIPARDTNGAALGAGVEIWGEVYTAPGATAATWTVSYTNQDGVSGRSATYAHPANAETVGQMVPFTLQAGDTGVRSVQSFTCSVSSGTAGDIGITLLRQIAATPIVVANLGNVLDFASLAMPRVWDDSCLAFMVRCSTTSSGLIDGSFVLGDYTP